MRMTDGGGGGFQYINIVIICITPIITNHHQLYLEPLQSAAIKLEAVPMHCNAANALGISAVYQKQICQIKPLYLSTSHFCISEITFRLNAHLGARKVVKVIEIIIFEVSI